MPLTPDQALRIAKIAKPLVEQIVEWIRDGLSDEEIRKRIADPGGVGQELLDAVRHRRDKFDDFIKNG